MVSGFIPDPGSPLNSDEVGALELGKAVALPDGRDEGGRRAGVDLCGGQGEHGHQALSSRAPKL